MLTSLFVGLGAFVAGVYTSDPAKKFFAKMWLKIKEKLSKSKAKKTKKTV